MNESQDSHRDDSLNEIYNLIKSQENGIEARDIAKRYPPKSFIVPYSLARLLADGKIRSEFRQDKLYCVAVIKELGTLGGHNADSEHH